MNLSDIWGLLPWMLLPPIGRGAASCFVGFVLPVGLFGLAGRTRSRWVRTLTRAVTSIVFLLAVCMFLLLLLFESACTRTAPPILSPDGNHVALVEFASKGALGDDYVHVEVRTGWNPVAQTVYRGLGYYDFRQRKRASSPEVRWLDRSTLLIRYRDDRTGHDGRGSPPICCGSVGDIGVVCANEATPPAAAHPRKTRTPETSDRRSS